MNSYAYKGYGTDGKRVSGELSAVSVDDAERRLASQGVTVTAVRLGASKKPSGSKSAAQRGKRVPDGEAAEMLANLATMSEAGVPFVEALDAVREGVRSPKTEQAIKALKDEIVEGRSISAALRNTGSLFPPMVADMVRVAEEGGQLHSALSSASRYLERSASLKKKVLGSMLYPMIMMAVSILTVGVLIVFVLPRFSAVFASMRDKLPATTKFLLSFGDTVRHRPLASLAVCGGVVALFVFVSKAPAASKVAGRLVLRLPVLGPLLAKLALSRALQSIATLLAGNVSVMSALEHGARAASNQKVSEALLFCRRAVEQGTPLSEAMRQARAFSPILVQMVGVGERTGRLASLMASCAQNMENEVDGQLKVLATVVEPLMIVVMGSVVATITMSIILPLYSVVENVK